MSEIDWSKAPEGATHYASSQGSWDAAWYILESENLASMLDDGIDTEWGWRPIDSEDRSELLPRLIPRHAPQWSGTGLPPVGTFVEMVNDKDYTVSDYGKQFIGEPCVVMAAFINSQGYDMVAVEKDDGACCCFRADMCRPILTEAQIAAEERGKELEAMEEVAARAWRSVNPGEDMISVIVSALHKDGYRKKEPKP